MAESITIARPYAQAVYAIAKEKGKEKDWAKWLEKLSAIAQNAEVLSVIKNPLVPKKDVVSLLYSILNEKIEKNTALTVGNLLYLMAENGRLPLLPEVFALFRQYLAEAAGEKEAVIYSAFPLDDKEVAALLKEVAPHFGNLHLTGRVVVDESLIGGVRICVGDKVLDMSVRSQLDQMAVALSN